MFRPSQWADRPNALEGVTMDGGQFQVQDPRTNALELSAWEGDLIRWLRSPHSTSDAVPFDLPWRMLCLLNALDKRVLALETDAARGR